MMERRVTLSFSFFPSSLVRPSITQSCDVSLYHRHKRKKPRRFTIKRCPFLGDRDYMKFIRVSLGRGKLFLKQEVQVRQQIPYNGKEINKIAIARILPSNCRHLSEVTQTYINNKRYQELMGSWRYTEEPAEGLIWRKIVTTQVNITCNASRAATCCSTTNIGSSSLGTK